jgi:hypothetical protein
MVDELGDPLIWGLACQNREKTRFFLSFKTTTTNQRKWSGGEDPKRI